MMRYVVGRSKVVAASLSRFHVGVTECGRQQRPTLAVDCGLDHHMTHTRELKSLAKQVELVCVANQRAPMPFQLWLTGLETGSRTHQALVTHIRGYDNYQIRATDRLHDQVFSPQSIVYLTPDSDTNLEEVEATKVYVVGGIVDLTINKNLTLHRARVGGLATARLPVLQYMEFSTHSPHSLNLPINIVVSMLLDRYSGQDWPNILQRHMPKRKGFRLTPT